MFKKFRERCEIGGQFFFCGRMMLNFQVQFVGLDLERDQL